MALPWDGSLDRDIGDQDSDGKWKQRQMVFGGAEMCPHHLG